MASYQAIKSKIKALEKAAQVALKKESASIIKKIHGLMSEYGITLADLKSKPAEKEKAARKKPGRKVPVAAKYRNPETGQTWSGRGKPPAWMVGPRKKGTADQFLITAASASKPLVRKIQKAVSKKTPKLTVAKKASPKKATKTVTSKKAAAGTKKTPKVALKQPRAQNTSLSASPSDQKS